MKYILKSVAGVTILFALIITGCANEPKSDKVKELETLESEKGEGEEDGTQYTLSEVCSVEKNGAHLILAYDADANSFLGTVENTSEEILENVRVEVHLSNGIELGPTKPADLKPGEKTEIRLAGIDKDFETWSAHAEIGYGEHNT